MSVAKVTFVLAFVLSCVFALDVSLDVSLKKDTPFVGSFTPENLYGDVTIQVEGTFDKTLILCLQEMTNLPFRNKYSTCTESIELVPSGTTTGAATTGASTGYSTSGASTGAATTGAGSYFARRAALGGRRATVVTATTTTYTVSLRNTLYNVGVYFKAEPAAEDSQKLTIKITGTSCPAGKTGETCNDDLASLPEGEQQFAVGEQYFYAVDVAASNTYTLTASADFSIQARFGATPYGDNNDYDVNGKELTLLSPSIGTWYIVLTPAASGASTLKGEGHNCDDNKVGKDCSDEVDKLEGETPYVTVKTPEEGKVYYYAIEGSLDSLIVSARTTTTNDKQPKLFAAFDRAPFFNGKDVVVGTYDLSGCNVETCSVLNQLNLKNEQTLTATNGTWYVAVQATSTAEILVWSNTVCPNNCGGNGSCKTSGDDYGVCSCENGHTGLLCTNDFTVEYVILIVIISLVAISAVIGLIAWAYMKSKHKGYEPV
eukprot:TRINITY_DN10454_c0_g1_i1.p1 TRINITY_DN10454_c0_g1~~TRINITY_DN10454_c0_g1_i1.p1  ORF type:complete len:487 (-),score=136.39 TRINITY_DN10454_c0_g1_i1:189-1649(-)